MEEAVEEVLHLLEEEEETHVVLPTARNARHAAWVAVAAAQALEPCHMLALAREDTSRRPHTSMLDVAATSTQFALEETSPASSLRAVC